MSKDAKELVCKLAQECISKTPVIILGSGASAAYGIPGMPQLKNHLLGMKCPSSATAEEDTKWSEFHEKLKIADLETALNDVRLTESLTNYVVNTTWDFLAPNDYKIFEKIISDTVSFPLTKLYAHLLNSTRNEIHVITPNYDRLAEYAADAGNFVHYTGFNYGHIRARAIDGRPRISLGTSLVRTVNVWKVHGSFDWFRCNGGIVLGLPVSEKRPANVTPIIVTPGIEKYRITYDEPFRSIKAEADRALQSAEAYFCIGYGFNDLHLQTTLMERCHNKSVPLVIITKEISPTTKMFMANKKFSNYLAIEESSKGCRIFCAEFPSGVEITGEPLWKLNEFLKQVIS